MFSDFCDIVAERYGNPNVVFVKPNEQLDIGTRVKVIPPHGSNADSMLDGVIVRHKRHGQAARVRLNGRTWFIRLDGTHQILKRW